MAENEDLPYLQLSENPVRFEPVSRVTNVFFDGTTKEVVSVRGGGTLGVVVQGLHTKEAFCMEDRGTITSLKFAPNHSRLAVQRTPNSLELLPFNAGEVGSGVVVECKTKSASLLGFVWADNDDLVLVTSHGIEFYHVSRERVFVRLVRSYSVPGCCWFVWSAECHMLVVASSSGATAPAKVALFPFQFAANYSNKMQKCVVDLHDSGLSSSRGGRPPPSAGDGALELSERDVCVAFVYRPAILVLRHPHDLNHTAQLLVFTNLKDSSGFKLTHICQLELTGRFAVNVIDSLIIVHHQASKVSLVFDVALGTEMRQDVCLVYPATRPAPIRPFCLEEPSVTSGVPSAHADQTAPRTPGAAASGRRTSTTDGSALVTQIPCQLYAPTWVVFQPSVIIDARLGCLWNLQLDLPAFAATFSDSLQLISCLLNRRHAKPLLLQTIRRVTERRALHILGPCFDVLNAGYRRHLDALCAQAQCGATGPMGIVLGGVGSNLMPSTSPLLMPSRNGGNVLSTITPAAVVEAVDMYQSVLAPLMELAQNSTVKHNAHSQAAKINTSSEVVKVDASSESEKLNPFLEHEKLKVPSEAVKLSSSSEISDKMQAVNLLDASEPDKSLKKNSAVKDGKSNDAFSEAMDESINYLVSVTLDYVRSLSAAGLPVPDFLHQLIVNALLNTGNFFQLHQLLQFHIVPDTKPLACVLLSRGGVYPACVQLSLDMLCRLRTAHEEIIEVLLANKLVTAALRYARANGLEDQLSCRKFLEAALHTGDDAIFYSVFTLFALRNTRLRGSRPFTESDHCETYIQHYKKTFGSLPDYAASVQS
ncbi:regulator of MON1-CCZ1 complex isoform X3 [Hyalella azteca]|uniref:Regulator of MON1-CCZ1 complex isoform X3 n=1 Tax=Hyalella azteca TaxID=294128 RepID=A0A979FNH8_HYAAZ|nr:regulator of MON1-CCZ1 complex isoform X3 [Hyalella azteca]